MSAITELDAYVELWAEVFDQLLYPGCGDQLREFYRLVLASSVSEPARLSGAAHELEFYRSYDDIGQPCGGYACDGHNAVCDDCGQAIDDYHQTLRSEMYR